MEGSERSHHPLDGTRIRFLDRLRDEGRRDAFDTRLAELKAPAKTKQEKQQAYWQSVHEFAPPPADETEPSPRPGADLVDPAIFEGKGAVPSTEAIKWVSSHIAVDAVEESAAPDAASWGLLRWARRSEANERALWEKLYPMVLRSERDEGRPEYSPPDPKAHGKAMAQIVEITDAAYGRSEGALARRFIENSDLWARVKPFVEDALNNKRKREAGQESILQNIPRRQRSESEDEFLTETERWVGEDPDRRWRLLRDHLRPLVLTGRPGRARSAPAEPLEETPQPTEQSA